MGWPEVFFVPWLISAGHSRLYILYMTPVRTYVHTKNLRSVFQYV